MHKWVVVVVVIPLDAVRTAVDVELINSVEKNSNPQREDRAPVTPTNR